MSRLPGDGPRKRPGPAVLVPVASGPTAPAPAARPGHVGLDRLRPAPGGYLTERGLDRLKGSLVEIAGRARAAVPTADGVGVTVLLARGSVRDGTGGFSGAVDDAQYGLLEGPCVEAVTTGEVVRSCSIGRGEDRWPSFTGSPAVAGLASVVSGPLRDRGVVVGSLNVYARTTDGLDPLDPVALDRTTDVAARALGSARLLAMADANAQWLAAALERRTVVDLAVGFVMDQQAVDHVRARAFLGSLARQEGVDEVVAARRLVAARRRTP